MQDISYGNINNFSIEEYQERCRIYWDEVEEVDLRVCFDTSILIKKFMEKL